jgi:hypothetical protein
MREIDDWVLTNARVHSVERDVKEREHNDTTQCGYIYTLFNSKKRRCRHGPCAVAGAVADAVPKVIYSRYNMIS